MSLRRLLIVPTLLAATAVPYLALDGKWKEQARQQVTQAWSGGDDASLRLAEDATEPAARPPELGPEIVDPREILRFDITPSQVMNRWHRVSTINSVNGLRGLRVAVVTGTEQHDLAGALTYYFDRNQRVQRIQLVGRTGNPQQLVDLMTRYFHLRGEPSLAPGLYLHRWNGVPLSGLRIEHAPVIRADEPLDRYLIQLELNRAGLHHELSREFEHLLHLDRTANRW